MTRDSDKSRLGLTPYLGALVVPLIAICRIGLVDAARTTYNFMYGDMPVLKQELVNYCREGIQRDNTDMSHEAVESKLRTELRYTFDGPVDPNRASIEDLWDTSEDYAKSGWDRWVWADLR